MERFTASNGHQIFERAPGETEIVDERGNSTLADYSCLDSADLLALREFFRAEEDERLGRWRWSENPEWVAVEADRSLEGRTVAVVNERTLDRFHVNERVKNADASSSPARGAARAFFEAHPEPESKPWHDAAEGEVWVLMFPRTSHVWFVNGDYFQNTKTLANILKTDPGIISGRRIWPEDAS